MVKDNEFARENLASFGREKGTYAYQMDHERKVLACCFPIGHSSVNLIFWIWRVSSRIP